MYITSGGLRSVARFDRGGEGFRRLARRVRELGKSSTSKELTTRKDLDLIYEFRDRSDRSDTWRKLRIKVPAGTRVSLFSASSRLIKDKTLSYDPEHFMLENVLIQDPTAIAPRALDDTSNFRPCHIIFDLRMGKFEVRHLDGVSNGANPMSPLAKISH